jgi:hypothetical protein
VRLTVVVLAACSREPTCDDLHGVWRSESGERWMMLDDVGTLEAYPLFDDARSPGEVAPRVIDLQRPALAGTQHRRYMRGADSCDDRVPVRVTCTGATLDIVLADSTPPLSFAPCGWPHPGSSRHERWRRE